MKWNLAFWICMGVVMIVLPLSYFSRPLALLFLVPAAAVGFYAGYKDDKAKGRPLWGFRT
jgi:hypothetical protein